MSEFFDKKNIVRILPDALINKIAAGEVVERPSSVVKELLENAIDAGATDIQVSLKNGGKDLISIIDNGCGMNESDAKISLKRHATSKIMEENDLFCIKTLGFRGEALAAISSVSNFELLTCDNQNQSGTRLYIKGGNLEQVGKIGFPQGTKVTVERLFFNTPARKKFLKTTGTELHHIQQHLMQKALAYPNIHFRLTHNQQILINLTGGQDLETRIYQLFGDKFKKILMPIKHEETYLKFKGFISFPSKPKTSRRWQYIFVNQRNVKCPVISHGIYNGYGTFLGKSQHPVFFINLNIEPTEIDVNVHPAKTEIRFRNSHLIHTILVDQISSFLKDGASNIFFGQNHFKSQMSDVGLSGQIELPIENREGYDGINSKNKKQRKESEKMTSQVSYRKEENPIETVFQKERISLGFKKSSEDLINFSILKKEIPSDNLCKDLKVDEVYNLSLLSPFPNVPNKIKFLGDLHEKFLVAQKEGGLVLFEVKLLHQRLLFEMYMSALQKKEVPVLERKIPILIELSDIQSDLLMQLKKFLINIGFSISHFGGNTFSINSNPQFLIEGKIEKIFKEFLEDLKFSLDKDCEKEIFKKISNVVALNGAEYSLEKLNENEMKFLIAKWEEFGSPLTSLKKTPMVLEISIVEIESRLKE